MTFATYLLSNEANQLSVEKVFVSLALFDIMKLPLTIIPMLTVDIAEVKRALRRHWGTTCIIHASKIFTSAMGKLFGMWHWSFGTGILTLKYVLETNPKRIMYIFLGIISHIRHFCSYRWKQCAWCAENLCIIIIIQHSSFSVNNVAHADHQLGASKLWNCNLISQVDFPYDDIIVWKVN